MSARYLVILRGINVGTRNRVPMADLRLELAGAGYTGVATVLQGGNLIVTASSDDAAEMRLSYSHAGDSQCRLPSDGYR